VRLFITENQITSPKVHGSAVCNPNYRRPVLRILVEREIMTPRINKKKKKRRKKGKGVSDMCTKAVSSIP
jgi:hypothetical protein